MVLLNGEQELGKDGAWGLRTLHLFSSASLFSFFFSYCLSTFKA
jgi:hypothetical protein